MGGFLGAAQFLTRVPLRLARPVAHERVVPWFPVVGSLIGLAVGGVAAAASLVVGPTLAAGLGVTTGLLVTGAFHEDGLADVADAFGGGWTVEERLAILKDSRHGTYGVAAMVSSILLRVLALAELAEPGLMLAGAVVAHTLARAAAVAALGLFPAASESGLGASVARSLHPIGMVASLLWAVGLGLGAVGWWAGPVLLVAASAMALTGALARAKIGGLVGDALGAIEQVAEVAILVTLAGLVGSVGVDQLWWT